jgi:FkbM family methyltransferase
MKETLNRLLARFGVRLVRSTTLPSWEGFFRLLRQYDLEPRTIFDIGVAQGTPQLYEAFPQAKFHLIDPTKEALPYMQAIAKRMDADVHNFALGDRETESTIVVRRNIGGSSFFEEQGRAPDVTGRYPVKVRRFDSIFSEFDRPALAKIDVQGAELAVIRGMEGIVRQIDSIIVEVSTIATVIGGPEVSDVIALLDQMGLRLYDILSLNRRPLDGALAQVDLAFVQEQSALRADKRWAIH